MFVVVGLAGAAVVGLGAEAGAAVGLVVVEVTGATGFVVVVVEVGAATGLVAVGVAVGLGAVPV